MKNRELSDEFKAKVILYPFPRCLKKPNFFNEKHWIFLRCATNKRHNLHPSPPERTTDVSCGLNRYARLPKKKDNKIQNVTEQIKVIPLFCSAQLFSAWK